MPCRSRVARDSAGARYTLFLDETGDHTMQFGGAEVPDPPALFLLCGCLVRTDDLDSLSVALHKIKMEHIGRTDVVLVSRHIRRRERQFAFLNDPARREPFLNDISTLVRNSPAIAFSAAIDKFRHWRRYGERALSPYDLSLAFVMERVLMCVAAQPATANKVFVVAESRGRREDAKLRLEYERLLRDGTAYVTADRFRTCYPAQLTFRRKSENVSGLQLADLLAYPLFQRLRYPTTANPAFEIVRAKLHRSRRGVWGAGLKVFPAARAADFGL